jgi:hypothetical protein
MDLSTCLTENHERPAWLEGNQPAGSVRSRELRQSTNN